jgi:hypothetical protein
MLHISAPPLHNVQRGMYPGVLLFQFVTVITECVPSQTASEDLILFTVYTLSDCPSEQNADRRVS